VVFVLTSGGERLYTGGYSPDGSSPTEVWPLLRALEAERLARTPGAVSTLPPAPPPPRPGEAGGSSILVGLGVIVLIAFGTLFMSMGVTEIGPALRAAHGGGTVGYFIPGQKPGGKAEWFGDFRLPDGTVTRRHTRIADLSKDTLHTGVPVAARDTGDPDSVFPRDDQGAWHGPTSVIVGAVWCLGWALTVIIRAGIRWLRRARHDDDGNVTALPWAAGMVAVSDAGPGDLRIRATLRAAIRHGCLVGREACRSASSRTYPTRQTLPVTAPAHSVRGNRLTRANRN
jgi:hypothetical protein